MQTERTRRDERRLVKTKTPGIYTRGDRYIVVWKHRGVQHKEYFATLAEAREAKGQRQAGIAGRGRGSTSRTTSAPGSRATAAARSVASRTRRASSTAARSRPTRSPAGGDGRSATSSPRTSVTSSPGSAVRESRRPASRSCGPRSR